MTDDVDAENESASPASLELTRRVLLASSAAGAALAVASGSGVLSGSVAAAQGRTPRAGTTVQLILRRREDLLRLPITLTSVTRENGKGGEKFSPGLLNSYLVAEFGPQHLTEQAFSALGGITPPAKARLSGPSRLAFFIPPSGVPATVEGLLDWARLQASVTGLARWTDGAVIPNNKDTKPKEPTANQTAIEMPWWLILSPHELSTWAHAMKPVTRNGRTELWHSRLAWHDLDASPPIDEAREDRDFFDFDVFTMRAVWLRDPLAAAMIATTGAPAPALGSEGYPFEMRPTPRDRGDIVRLTSKTTVSGDVVDGGRARAIPLSMSLSALGGTMNVAADWAEPNVASLIKWEQRSWQGRDTFVRTVRQGYLYPWGIPAALDQQVVRVFAAGASGGIRPYQQLKSKVVITTPTVDLQTPSNPYSSRATPFTKVTCTTVATPELAVAATDLFVPKVQVSLGGALAPVMFEFVGIDQAGRSVAFRMPAMFVEHKASPRTAAVRAAYSLLSSEERTCDFGGSAVGFAPEQAGGQGQTTHSTGRVVFTLSAPQPGAGGLRRDAFPAMTTAEVLLDDASRIAGAAVNSTLEYAQAYLQSAFNSAANQVQAYLKNTANQAIALGAKEAGGLLASTLDVAGLSRSLGIVPGKFSDIESLAANAIINRDPLAAADGIVKMFGATKLFSGISLADILGSALDLKGPKALKVVTTVANIGKPNAAATTKLTWNPSLDVVNDTPAEGVLDVSKAALSITVTSTVSLADGSSTWTSEGRLTGLKFRLVKDAPFVMVELAKVVFTAGTGRDANVDIDIGEVSFQGALTFLAELQKHLPSPPSGLALDVTSKGITAGYTFTIPDIAIGAYTLTGLGVGAGITIPFDDKPVRTRFNFSGPDNPFGMTAIGLGGAGWFKSAMGLDGVEKIDIAGMLQAAVAVNFGVASGSVRIMAGFQFQMVLTAGKESLTLTAFIRIMGRVDVLGLIEASIEVYIGLSAIVPPLGSGKRVVLAGEASISVKVKVLFVSKTVSWTVRKEIQGAVVPDPADFIPAPGRLGRADSVVPATFAKAMKQADWNQWCGAFA